MNIAPYFARNLVVSRLWMLLFAIPFGLQHSLAQETGDHKVAVYYVIPRDIAFEQHVYDRVSAATREIQAWYKCATNGKTWKLAFPETVRVYRGNKTRQEYADSGFYGAIIGELQSQGLPAFTPGFVTALWFRGAGLFAGANPGCDGHCGFALLGVEGFPEFNVPAWSGRTCPAGVGGAAWPCTPLGAFAHELGHALAGLPHPLDVAETQAVAFHSIMQTHWHYPSYAPATDRPWGFLSTERLALRRSPFLSEDVAISNPASCELPLMPRRPKRR